MKKGHFPFSIFKHNIYPLLSNTAYHFQRRKNFCSWEFYILDLLLIQIMIIKVKFSILGFNSLDMEPVKISRYNSITLSTEASE